MHARMPILLAVASVASLASAQLTFTNSFGFNDRSIQTIQPPRDNTRFFIVEQRGWDNSSLPNTTGRIRAFNFTTQAQNAVTLLLPGLTAWGEGGLLGMAFHPDYNLPGSPNARFFYVNVTTFHNSQGVTEIRRYEMDPANPNVALPGSMQVVLRLPQPGDNHNGGTMRFGPDGLLYIGLGDGGGTDPAQGNRSQDINNLLGKMLRIDVNGDDFPADPDRNYRIPANNPFAGPTPGADEIWAMGLRNPWKWEFDYAERNGFGGIVISDVGGTRREEISYILPTAALPNFGWPNFEGRFFWGTPISTGTNIVPFIDHTHDTATSILGGLVYRGVDMGTDFYGAYFYADSFDGWVSWQKLNFDLETGALLSSFPTFAAMTEFVNQGGTGFNTSFDMDHRGEIWASTYQGRIRRITRTGGNSRALYGTIQLQDLAGPLGPKGVNVEIRMNSNPSNVITLQVGLSPNGTFQIPVPTGAGRVSIKHGSWLRQVIPFDSTGGNVTGVSFSLRNGDVDGSGEVDLTDIDTAIGNYLLSSNDPGYAANRNSDVDRNGEVDLTDIDLIIGNYLEAEDPL